jgi:hypothetical protein
MPKPITSPDATPEHHPRWPLWDLWNLLARAGATAALVLRLTTVQLPCSVPP